ncbi:MAG: peptidoglycan editing factor PgeF [Legionellaceae bacterium]|nr:peptidoglycan editing factor PgeF [Legionellaceae bacterium]
MQWINANWPAPPKVHALTTTRSPGESLGAFAQNNLAFHVGDDSDRVRHNRHTLQQTLQLEAEPLWLDQTHSSTVVYARNNAIQQADASISQQKNLPLAIMTADCLPIVICNQSGSEIAAIHAGWRGLVQGIIENTLRSMHSQPLSLMAWIGPGICGRCFEIGSEILPIFQNHANFSADMLQLHSGRWSMNLALLAKKILQSNGVTLINSADCCTFERHDLFYSYRRQAKTGRMATLIWLS